MTTAGHWTVVREVISSTDTGAQVMGALPGLVRRLLNEEAWRDFTTPDGREVRYDRFTAFVEAMPPRGLGGRVSQLIALCGTDGELGAQVRELALADIPAAAHRGANQHSGVSGTQSSRDAGSITARLKRDDPELAARVMRREITPNAAAQTKGWRKPRVLVTSPESVARKLREHFTAEQLAELIRLLLTVGDS